MIQAYFTKDAETGVITRIKVSGHAGFDEFGYDVVCASVSALVIGIVNGLEEYVGIDTNVKVEEGFTSFEIRPETEVQSIQSDALSASFYLALEGLSEEYEGFVEVNVQEESRS